MGRNEHTCALQIVPSPTAPPQDGECPTDQGVEGHIESGIAFHSMLQMDDGHFPGDYGGPMFLMPGMIISCYVTGVLNTVLTPQHKLEMVRYLKNHQNEDGGFGLHIEGHSTMFGTGLRFAALFPTLLHVYPHAHSTSAFRIPQKNNNFGSITPGPHELRQRPRDWGIFILQYHNSCEDLAVLHHIVCVCCVLRCFSSIER